MRFSNPIHAIIRHGRILALSLLLMPAPLVAEDAAGPVWWDKAWPARKPLDITVGGTSPVKEPVRGAVLLIRLHEGNFAFASAREDGSDIRFVADDGKTVLPHRIERYDALMNEAILWVKVGELKPVGGTRIWMYSGNQTAPAAPAEPVFSEETRLVWHFSDKSGAPTDSSGKNNSATGLPTISEGSLIGGGLRFFGNNGLEVAASDSLSWKAGQELTISFWVKPAARPGRTPLLRREDGQASLAIGLADGKPYVEINDGSGATSAEASEAIADGQWKHVAVVSSGGKCEIFLNAKSVGTLAKPMPAFSGPLHIGARQGETTAMAGEVDELRVIGLALTAAQLNFDVASQSGSEDAAKLLAIGGDEASAGGAAKHNEAMEHMMLFGDIAKNMMFDGWVVVFACGIMAIVGWTVAARKLMYLNKISKANDLFLTEWRKLANDLTALDHGSDGKPVLEGERKKIIKQSPLYHLYHIGSEEIDHRVNNSKAGFKGLSGRSIQAIKACLDAGIIKEQQKLNGGLVFLTISIAGGPYVGLLGTVMGVMITFAVIAKTGEVEVNSIAPGIASALLATVAGLIVAIPALFIYSYLASRIKDVVNNLHVFIDEFITKMAEFYKETN